MLGRVRRFKPRREPVDHGRDVARYEAARRVDGMDRQTDRPPLREYGHEQAGGDVVAHQVRREVCDASVGDRGRALGNVVVALEIARDLRHNRRAAARTVERPFVARRETEVEETANSGETGRRRWARMRHEKGRGGTDGEAVGTLRRTYQTELAGAAIKANARVAESLFRKATGDGREGVIAAIFWMKTRAGWRESIDHRIEGAPTFVARIPEPAPSPEAWIEAHRPIAKVQRTATDGQR